MLNNILKRGAHSLELKNILIVVFGNTGTEPEALRQTLECFNFFVATKYIAGPGLY